MKIKKKTKQHLINQNKLQTNYLNKAAEMKYVEKKTKNQRLKSAAALTAESQLKNLSLVYHAKH